MDRTNLAAYLDQVLQPAVVRDYCPNGLQVEGQFQVRHIICGVTACQALIDVAIARGADTLLVHHGYFWKGEDARIVGLRAKRMRALMVNHLNLFAYHLPLDLHPELGNNAQLAQLMGWSTEGRFAEQNLGFIGRPSEALNAGALADQLTKQLSRPALLVGQAERQVRRIAWCTGAAQNFFEAAIEAGADAYVSGEISEQTVHLARESGVPYISAGHHASERYGVAALGKHLEAQFGIRCDFVDIDSPV